MAYNDTSGLHSRRPYSQPLGTIINKQQNYQTHSSGNTYSQAQGDSNTLNNKQNAQQDPYFVLNGDLIPTSFRNESYQIAKDVVHYVCQHESPVPSPTKAAATMRDLVDDTLKSRLDMMCRLVNTLDVKKREELELINSIATNMFDDQVVNWSRIVTLCSFCGYLARSCEQKQIPDCSDDIAKILAEIVVNRLGLWIVANGGWNSFHDQFPSMCNWSMSGIWKGIGIIILVIGCILAFCSSVRLVG